MSRIPFFLPSDWSNVWKKNLYNFVSNLRGQRSERVPDTFKLRIILCAYRVIRKTARLCLPAGTREVSEFLNS